MINTAHILVVDDEPHVESLILQRFRRQIREKIYIFTFACDGEEALQKLRDNPGIDIVLTDINMPRMDGLTLLEKIREAQLNVNSVVVSAYGDLSNIRTAMNRGAFDFVTKPIDFSDLEITLQKTWDQIRKTKESLRQQEQLKSLRSELDIASNIQRGILPTDFPAFPGLNQFDIYARMESAREVGGDLYDFFLLDNDRISFAVGDVSGKGVPAALFMAVSRTLLRATATAQDSIEKIIQSTNQILASGDHNSMFVTLIYGILNFRTGDLELCSAGHDAPFLKRADGTVEQLYIPSNLVLGAEEDMPFLAARFQLFPGDLLFMYTDGITEARNPSGGFYLDERLKLVLENSSATTCQELVNAVHADVAAFSGEAEQYDDETSLCIQYRGESKG